MSKHNFNSSLSKVKDKNQGHFCGEIKVLVSVNYILHLVKIKRPNRKQIKCQLSEKSHTSIYVSSVVHRQDEHPG